MSNNNKGPLAGLTTSSIMLYLRRHTYLTVAIVSWVAMAILTVAVVLPQINLITAHNENLGVEEKKLQDLQTRSRFLQALNPDTLRQQHELFQAVLPSQKPVSPLISSIERLALNAGATLQSYELSPGTIATEGARQVPETRQVKSLVEGVGALPLKLEVQGGFISMNTFFKSLDTVIPLVNVKTIDFTVLSQTRDAAPEAIQYKAAVELDSLYALPQSTRADPNAVLTAFNASQQNLIASLSAMVASQPQLSGAALQAPQATPGAGLRQSIFAF